MTNPVPCQYAGYECEATRQENERLRAELETEKAAHRKLFGAYQWLTEQRATLTADAERYRFLRNHTWVEAYWIDGAGGVDTKTRVSGCADHLDKSVDLERIKERPGAEPQGLPANFRHVHSYSTSMKREPIPDEPSVTLDASLSCPDCGAGRAAPGWEHDCGAEKSSVSHAPNLEAEVFAEMFGAPCHCGIAHHPHCQKSNDAR